MVQKQKVILGFLLFLCATSVFAQEKRKYFKSDNWYIGARGGVVNSMAENINGFLGHMNPTFSFEVGKVLTKEFQVRATLGYYRQTGEASDACTALNPLVDTYNFSMMYLGADFMIDVTSGFTDEPKKFHILPTVGVGGIYSYGFDKDLRNWYIYPVDTKSTINPVFRLGVVSHVPIRENLDLSLNALWNVTADRYNGMKTDNGGTNSFFELSAGFVVRFKDTYNEYRFRNTKGPKDDYWLMLRKHRKRWLKK